MDQATAVRLVLIALGVLVVGFVCALAAWWNAGRWREVTRKGPAWAIPLAGALTYMVAQPIIVSRIPWPMSSAQDRPLVAAAMALVLAMLARRLRFASPVRWVVRAFVVLAAGAFIAWRQVSGTWSATQSAVTLGGFVGATLLTWWMLERVTDAPAVTNAQIATSAQARARGLSAALVASATAGAAANALILTFSSLSLAQMGGVLATFMIGVAGATLFRPRISLALGTAHVVAVVTQAMLLVGLITTDTPLERFYPWLVALVPGAAAAVDALLRTRADAKPWTTSAARVAAAAIAVGAVTALAAMHMPEYE